MNDEQWDTIAALLDHGWKGGFDDDASEAYRTLLNGYDSQAILTALRSLLRTGQPFIPAAAEIVAAIEDDPTLPTWTEAWPELQRAWVRPTEEEALAEANRVHPWLAAFLRDVGYRTLRQTAFFCPQYGPIEVNRLRQRWEEWLERAHQRDRAGLPVTQLRAARSGLRRLDPTTALERRALPPPAA